MRWKDFLYFQRGSKIAVILLLVLILLTLILNSVLSYRNSSELVMKQNDSLIRAFDAFRSTLKERETSLTPTRGKRGGDRIISVNTPGEAPVGSRRTAGKTYLRDKGKQNEREEATRHQPYIVSEKLTAGETISLNETDTTRWKMIPGIGSTYASRIVKYKELLGGYVRKEQLLEVYGVEAELYARISPYIEPDSHCVKLQVNRAEFRELLRHPYLNYEQVKVIVGLRRRKGNILFINELAMLEEFTSDDIRRLEPYLAF